jgi:hypothetical protein
MHIVSSVVLCMLALSGSVAHGQPHAPPAAPESQRDIREAATRVLESLDADMRAKAMFAFDDTERFNFHFVPRPRKGLPLKDLTSDQRDAAHRLLQTALSTRGYTKVSGIIELEELLYQRSNRNPIRDPNQYFLTFFGEPSADRPWGWRFEGHHLSLNFSSVDGALFSTTPAFMGANPAEVRSGPSAGLRVLAAEEDLGRALVHALDPEQRERAVISAQAPSDIITGADRKAMLQRFEGLPAAAMTEAQVAMLWGIVEEYAHNLRPDMADAQLARIREAGIENLHFAWAGRIEPGRPHYYRIHGPTVLFEYDNVQNNANHIHSVWRDIENDFGEDILRRHYETARDDHGHQ